MDFSTYSPVEELKLPLFEKKKVTVKVKRDDMMHPFISGNKWRKLKHTLKDAQEKQKTKLVTFGGAWSNHLLATACAGAKFGFQTKAFIRGEEVNNPVLAMCKIFGMELRFVDRTTYRNKESIFSHHETENEAYFIDEGGRSALGMLGCSELMAELDEDFDHVVLACGTGTTLAGISKGCQQYMPNCKTHGIPVLKGGNFLYDDISALGIDLNAYSLHLDYHFGGYAKSTPTLTSFIKEVSSTTGVLLETIYTGKAFYGLCDLVENDYFAPGQKILFIHTGGLTGLLGMYEKF